MNYTDFSKALKAFQDLKANFEKMTCNCFGLYRLGGYEKRGTQGTQFVYLADAETEDELMDLAESKSDLETYLILPIQKRGNGTIVMNNKPEKVITSCFHEYKGVCKVLLATSMDGTHYKNPNERTWITLKSVESGIECTPSYGDAIDERPDNWRDYNVHKSQMRILWRK